MLNYENIFKNLDQNYIKIGNSTIFVIVDNDENIWFHGNQAVIAFGYMDIKQVKRSILPYERTKYRNIKHKLNLKLRPNTIFMSEAGFYDFIFTSKKPLAIQFRQYVARILLPAIRKHILYQVEEKCKKRSNNLLTIIDELKTKLEIFEKNAAKHALPKGGMVYVVEYVNDGSKYYRISRTIDTNSIKQIADKHTLKQNKVAYYEESICSKTLETCVKLKLDRYKFRESLFRCKIETIKEAFKQCTVGTDAIANIENAYCINNQSGGAKLMRAHRKAKIMFTKTINLFKKQLHETNHLLALVQKKIHKTELLKFSFVLDPKLTPQARQSSVLNSSNKQNKYIEDYKIIIEIPI